MKSNYPIYSPEFAAEFWIPFSDGPHRKAIMDTTVSFETFRSDPRSRLTVIPEKPFTDADLAAQWRVIIAQRKRLQVFYLQRLHNFSHVLAEQIAAVLLDN